MEASQARRLRRSFRLRSAGNFIGLAIASLGVSRLMETMKASALIERLAICLAVAVCSATLLQAQEGRSQQPKEEEVRGAPAELDDAAEVRAQITAVEKMIPTYVDRGAVLYFLAASKIHLGETREALDLLKQCMS